MPRSFTGAFSITSVAPTPHSPPIPMPKSARSQKNIVYDVAIPDATSSAE